MCSPTLAIAGVAFGAQALGAIQQFSAQNSAVDAQQEAEQERIATERQALANRRQEQTQAAAQEGFDVAREAAIVRGRVRVSAGEAGGIGNTTTRLINDVTRQAGLQTATIDANQSNFLRNVNLQDRSIRRGGQLRLEALEARRPSALATGLQIAGAGAQAFGPSVTRSINRPSTASSSIRTDAAGRILGGV